MGTEGFERAVSEHKDRIYSYAAMMLRNPADAQDVAQETTVRLWQNRSEVEASTARAWLLRTAHNLCIDRMRRRKVRGEVEPAAEPATADEQPGPLRLAASSELGRLLARAIAELPAEFRAVVVLREIETYPTTRSLPHSGCRSERSRPGCTERGSSCGSAWSGTE